MDSQDSGEGSWKTERKRFQIRWQLRIFRVPTLDRREVDNFHSGTAQAALTIPIMAPLGDLVGITRQTSVFAFQLAEYINPVLPTSGVTMGVLGLAGLKWEKWAKWLVPLLVLWVLFAALTLIPPVLMKWGPNSFSRILLEKESPWD